MQTFVLQTFLGAQSTTTFPVQYYSGATSIHYTSPIMFLLSAPPFRLVSVIDVDSSIKCDYDPLPPLQTLPLPLQNCHQLDQCHRFENREIVSSYLREYKR